MSQRVVIRQPWPTKEEREKRRELTIARIRALTGAQAKELLEDLIARWEVTGICLYACEYVDKVALTTIQMQAQIARQVETVNPKLKFVESYDKTASRHHMSLSFARSSGVETWQKMVETINRTFSAGNLAWERLDIEEDGETMVGIVRFVEAQ